MILKICPSCLRPTTIQSGHCPDCLPAALQEQKQTRSASARKSYAKRDKKLVAFYKSREWIELCRGLMSLYNYQCQAKHEGCTGIAVEVHHIIPLDTPEGWARRLDPTNCIIVCLNCHNFAHNRFQKRRGATHGGR